MKTNNEKINLIGVDGKMVTFSGFSLTQINYTFDIWSPDKDCNEICLRKDELVSLFKVLKNFTETSHFSDLVLQDYDSPSTVEVKYDKSSAEVQFNFNLTYPSTSQFSVRLNKDSVPSVLTSLSEVISTVDDKDYEEKMTKEYGMDFTF